MPMIWSRGEWYEDEDFVLSVYDRGLLHGLGAFETMLALDGVIQYGGKHLRRLQGAIERMGLCDVSAYDFLQIGRELCEKNQCASGRARLRLTVTAGEGSLSEKGPGAGATVWMTATPLAATVSTLKVVTLPWTRNERSALAGMKTSSYAENLLGLQWARAQGADEGIFFNTRDELCEACTANVFVRLDGLWHTPKLDSGCLPGVMREVILERDASIRESVITLDQVARAEEMFLTSAIRGVIPVSCCDGSNLLIRKMD
jgi:branched-subunit amino acid aminotransferase/4-amino-4-deoxychorismate lyase